MSKKRSLLAFDVEPATHRFRLRLARYRYQADVLNARLTGPGASLLDAGCGSGRFARFWERWGNPELAPRLTALDLKSRRLDRARGGYQAMLRADLTAPWPIRTGSYDVVILEQVIEHFDDPTGAFVLSEARRVLKVDGLAFIGAPVFPGPVALFHPIWLRLGAIRHRLLDGPDATHHEQHFSLRSLRRTLRRSGFVPEVARGFRLGSLPKALLENSLLYYRSHMWFGRVFPGWCVEVIVTARKG